MIFSRVVLPAPLAPTSATLAPSPTRNDTSSSSTRPSAAAATGPLGRRRDPQEAIVAPDSSAVSPGFPAQLRTNRCGVNCSSEVPERSVRRVRSVEGLGLDGVRGLDDALTVAARARRDHPRDERCCERCPAPPGHAVVEEPHVALVRSLLAHVGALGVGVDVVAADDEDVGRPAVVGEARHRVISVERPDSDCPVEGSRVERIVGAVVARRGDKDRCSSGAEGCRSATAAAMRARSRSACGHLQTG